MYLKFVLWWAALLEKKIYVAITLLSTALLCVSVGWHMYDSYVWGKEKNAMRKENNECIVENRRIRQGNELINSERINELKADRDTAFARLDRLTALIKNK